MHPGKLFFIAGAAMLLFAACGSTRASGRYDYLRSKDLNKPEPYDVVALAVLDTAGGTPDARPKPAPPKPDKSTRTAEKTINTARSYLGVPYRYGGLSHKGLDCSGLMVLAFRAVGKQIPRTSSAQSQLGTRLRKKEIQPGDLVFFDSNLNGRINHVGLVTRVLANDLIFIHATTSRGVVEDRISTPYYSKRYKWATRI